MSNQPTITPAGIHTGAIIEISHLAQYQATIYVIWLEQIGDTATLWSNDDNPNAFLKDLNVGDQVRFISKHIERLGEHGKQTKAQCTPIPTPVAA